MGKCFITEFEKCPLTRCRSRWWCRDSSWSTWRG